MKSNEGIFKILDYSNKQKQIVNWWRNLKYQNKDIVIADGAIRSGKTISMIDSFLRWSMLNFNNKNFIVAGKSIGSLKKNVISPMIQIINFNIWHFEYNRSSNFLVIGSNTYYFYGASTEASQDTLQGLTAAGALADEIALFPKSFVDQMIARCSIEGSKIFCNCNPNGPYHFFKKDYIDKADEKNILYLHFTMDDNLTLSEKVKDKYKRMYDGVFYKRYILGQWVMAEGIIYDMFDEDKHTVDTSNLNFEQYYISIDYGTQNPTSFGLWGLCNKVWYRVKEFYYSGREQESQKTDQDYYNELIKFSGNLNIRSLIIDPSAASFIALIKQKGKYHIRKAKNDVLEGIRNTATALNETKVLIDKSCKNLIKEIYSYSWDSKAVERGEDKPIKQNDHACDDMRYFINTIIYNNEPAILF
jgi:PBSX family phage terminase large subunit